jgi:hypothetical protein
VSVQASEKVLLSLCSNIQQKKLLLLVKFPTIHTYLFLNSYSQIVSVEISSLTNNVKKSEQISSSTMEDKIPKIEPLDMKI